MNKRTKTVDIAKITDIYERLASLHVDVEDMDFEAISDLDDVFTYISRALDSMEVYCKRRKIQIPNVF